MSTIDSFSTGGVSCSYWYYHDSLPGSGFPNRFAIIYLGSGTNDNFVILHDAAAGVGTQCLWTVGSNNFFAFEGQNTFDTGHWHHELIVTDFSSGNSAIYIDGVAQTLAGSWSSPPDTTGSTAYYIGGVNYGNESMSGRIADMALWKNVRLNSSEAAALARGVRPNHVRPASLFRWWPLDGLASPEPDYSGSFNNGTLNNTVTSAAGPPVAPFTPRQLPLLTGMTNVKGLVSRGLYS